MPLLAEGYSNSTMAEKLFLSVSNVRNINMKLGPRVERRRWRLHASWR